MLYCIKVEASQNHSKTFMCSPNKLYKINAFCCFSNKMNQKYSKRLTLKIGLHLHIMCLISAGPTHSNFIQQILTLVYVQIK